MNRKTSYSLLVLFLVYSLPIRSSDDELKRGLYFQSFEVDKDKRTSLDLTPHRPLVFNHGFTMEFDLKLRREKQSFGYVFRIICNETLNMDFMIDIPSVTANFLCVVQNRTVIQFKKEELGNTIENTWINVVFVFDPDSNRIILSLNGIKKEAPCPAERMNRFSVCFGGNMYRNFLTTDVSPMTVKDIRFFNEKQQLVRHWELAKHATDGVYDECISDRATAQNPIWEIDSHVKWKKIETFVHSGQNHHIAFNRNDGLFYFINDREIIIYDIKRDKMDTLEVLAGYPFNCRLSNLLVYDPNRHVLVSYDFERKGLATFDFATRRWDNDNNAGIIQRYMHHSRLFIAEDSLLITFGGYGFHRYQGVMHKCYVTENVWAETRLSPSIAPRYLGSMGQLDNRQLLYFGGFGSESGEQTEYSRNYYDLHTIDIDNAKVLKRWTLPNPEEHFTNSNTMVVDKTNGKLYALAYPNMRHASIITLHEYNLEKPEYRAVGDSFPYFFNDLESYCDLFQSADSTELYAVTSHVRDNQSEIAIYAIAFPPLSLEEIIRHPPPRAYRWIWLAMIAVILSGVFIYCRKRKIHPKEVYQSDYQPISDKEEESVLYDNIFEEIKPLSINLLGNFQIIDGNRNELSANFTPITMQLFLLILMATIKNGKGIPSPELRKILWFDKDEDSARNNRNVNIAKLRAFLKDFTEVKVINREGYWTIEIGKTVFCDYERVCILMKILKTGVPFNKKLLSELVDIALKGTLLPHIQQQEWLEPYQTDYTNMLIESLIAFSKRDEVKTDLILLLKMADAILLHDNIDEDAIQLKCHALFHAGRKNQALQSFNKFTADYKYLLAADHQLKFEELIK